MGGVDIKSERTDLAWRVNDANKLDVSRSYWMIMHIVFRAPFGTTKQWLLIAESN
jgi:hypothetical protein